MWLTLAISFSVFSRLYQALNIAWHYEDYAGQQMRAAREHRAELMRISKALKETQQGLEHANAQLSHARHSAEEARRLKVLFAANVSHELRTPINLIVGFSEMIITAPQSYGVPLPSAYWTDINIVYRNARHLQSLINDVLDISQIEAGQMALMKEEVDPAVVILEAAELVRESITRRGLAFEIFVPETLPQLWLDRLRIRQVILNLLSNAMRFTDEGKITLQASVVSNFLHINVCDTGVGIQAEDLDSIFEEFHQLENSLSKQYGGSGLGLTLSKQFVEMHGGQIRVQSEGLLGQGSKFSVILPVFSGSPGWRFRVQARHTQDIDSARSIVVLDDDPAILQLFERYTEKHHAIGVQECEEALYLAEMIQPTALIIDNKDANKTLQASLVETMRSRGLTTPIISCSMPSGRRILRSLGVADYLVKPVTSEALLHALDGLKATIKHVLIVDDEPDIVRMFSRMLQNAAQPYQIWKAYNGREGLMLMREKPPDVVILDVLMPEVDGFGVIEHMKAHPALTNIPIVLTSARGTFDAITPSTDGIISVHKPAGFQPIELIRCVESIVNTLTPATEPAH
jgi:signal transduction histidine kinase/CheY-like chemotaxis protein